MSKKSRGTNAERDLVRMFWANGWAALRSAGSGSQQYPSPDVLVGKEGRRLAIESKLTIEKKKYFPRNEIRDLKYFASIFGAEPWLAVKFQGEPWYFFHPEDLVKTEKFFVASLNQASMKGLLFEELIEM